MTTQSAAIPAFKPAAANPALTASLLVFGGWIAGILLALVTIWVLVKFIGFMATEGNPGDNLYGPDPYGRRYGY